jgi:four helix bundle protein
VSYKSQVTRLKSQEELKQSKMNNFKQLKAWSLGKEIATEVYQIAFSLNNQEQYVFASQLSRAAISIPGNVAEGNSRRSKKDFARFVEMALGSAYELETQLSIMHDLTLGDQARINLLLSKIEEEQKMLHGLIRKLIE